MTLILIAIACIFNAIMDNIMAYNTFGRFGLWFSNEGWKIKYMFADWLMRFIPKRIALFIAVNIAAPFCDFWHFSKILWIICFCLAISLSLKGILYFLFYSLVFCIVFPLIKYIYDKKE